MARQLYRISTGGGGGVQVIDLRLPHSLDAAEFDGLNESLLPLVEESACAWWVVDLSAVNYLGSAMLGLLVNVRQRVQQKRGEVVLCGLSASLERIVRTSCMDRLFRVVPTRQEAVQVAQASGL